MSCILQMIMYSKRWQRLCMLVAVVFGAIHFYLSSHSFLQQRRLARHESMISTSVFNIEDRSVPGNVRGAVSTYSNFTRAQRLIAKSIYTFIEENRLQNEVNTKYNGKTSPDVKPEVAIKISKKDHDTNLTKPVITSEARKKQHTSDDVTMVIILTYIRSGSSFTGDILQQDPDSFYVYEPLHYTEAHFNLTRVLQLNGRNWNIPQTYWTLDHRTLVLIVSSKGQENPYDFEPTTSYLEDEHVNYDDSGLINKQRFLERAETILRSYFSCQFGALDFGTIVHGFQTFGNKTNKFIQCFQRHASKTKNRWFAAVRCSKELEKLCSSSKFRIIKTIRLPMSFLIKMMNTYKNLKIIHLVRDPRAQIYSIVKIAKTNKFNAKFAKQKCKQMDIDYTAADIIQHKFPKRFLRVQYEDLASYPQKVSRHMYNFIGMNFTDAVIKYIHGITNSGGEDNCSICSKRGNSSEHVDKWRKEMSFQNVKVLDSICIEMYKKYGYYMASNEHVLKNLSIPLRNIIATESPPETNTRN